MLGKALFKSCHNQKFVAFRSKITCVTKPENRIMVFENSGENHLCFVSRLFLEGLPNEQRSFYFDVKGSSKQNWPLVDG